jgi:hypothetical protein
MKRSCCLIAVLAGFAGGTASADPDADPCAVRFVRAPAGMAPVIAARLQALQACTMPLDVWIVRSDEGLYLVARDGLGRMRERMVPDVEVAAALIASWVEPGAFESELAAPDATPAPDAAAITPEPTPAPRAAVVSAAPGTVSPRPDLDEEPPPSWNRERDPATPAAAPRTHARTFAIGGQVGVTWDNETTRGMHVELELMRRGGAFFSFDGQLVQELGNSYYVVDAPVNMLHFEEIGRSGLDALVRAGYHVGRRVYFRPSLAAGLGVSRHEILRTEPNPFFPAAGTYTDWSYGVRIGFAAAIGLQFESLAIEMSVLELASLQQEKPGVSGDDRMISAGVGLRFRR